MHSFYDQLKPCFSDLPSFAWVGAGLRLRSYQLQAGLAIVDSVLFSRGMSFVVIFPRQSGKNELQAHIEAFLLSLFSKLELREMVKISPTWKPQSLNAMRRLERSLRRNVFMLGRWGKDAGYIYRVGNSSITFLSGSPEAHIVGATASALLQVDEAQDVSIDKYDKEIAPMTASTNATRVFWGTAWTSRTLLARELRAARAAQLADGVQRVFIQDACKVGAEVPAYRKHVEAQVARLGRQHPMIKTQYFSEEIDAEGGMFPASRRALMFGDHLPQPAPLRGHLYAFTIDVAGEDEGASLQLSFLDNPQRDATALTIFEVTLDGYDAARPLYRVVERLSWQGTKHTVLFPHLRALAETWRPRFVVVDATGIGSGLATYLESFLSTSVIRFEFSSASKSKLGWDFIALIETGRYKEPAWSSKYDPRQQQFIEQLDACQYEILDGPGKLMRWGVPDGTRQASSGDYLHDDLVISAALVCVLDRQVWGEAVSKVLPPADPLDKLQF